MENIKKSQNKYINPSLVLGTIKQSKGFLIIWMVIILIIVLMSFGVYLALGDMIIVAGSNEMNSSLSPNIDILKFYMSINGRDALGMGLIFTAIVAMSALLKEENKNTAEFLFAHPISRKKMFFTQMLSFLSILFIFSFIIMVISLIMMIAFDGFQFNFDIGQYLLYHSYMFIINVVFGSFMYGLASLKKGKNYLALALGISIGMYIVFSTLVPVLIMALTDKVSWIDNLNYLFIANMMDTAQFSMNNTIGFNWQPLVIWLIPAIGLNVWGYFRYQKKDLNCA